MSTLRERLQQIVDYEPEHVETYTDDFQQEVAACKDCDYYRRIRHPISTMCSHHYSRLYRRKDENDRRDSVQHYALRTMAESLIRDLPADLLARAFLDSETQTPDRVRPINTSDRVMSPMQPSKVFRVTSIEINKRVSPWVMLIRCIEEATNA